MNNLEEFFDSEDSNIPSIKSENETSPTTSFLSMRYFYILGYFTGNMPFQGLVTAKSSMTVKFEKCSVAFVLSWAIFFLKFSFVGDFISVVEKGVGNFTQPPPGSSTFLGYSSIDEFAISKVFAINLAFGLASHFIFVLSAKKFIELLQQLESYEQLYPTNINTSVLNIWILCAIACICYTVAFLAIPIWSVIDLTSTTPVFFFNSIPLGPGWVTAIAYTLGIFFVEYGVLLVFIKILHLSNVLSSKLEDIIKDVEELSERKFVGANTVDKLFAKSRMVKTRGTQPADSSKIQPWLAGSDGTGFEAHSWKTLGDRYIKLERIFKAYEKFTGPLLIAIFVTLVASTICIIYLTTADLIVKRFGYYAKTTTDWLNVMVFIELFAFANVGETFQQKYEQLVETTVRVRQMRGYLQETELDEFDQFRQLVSTVRIKLSAAGFFNVHRGNITSIASVIITYIIVLLQFRQSEDHDEE